MKDSDYKPFYLESIKEINDNHFILNGFPQYDYNEDSYYEIDIESNRPLYFINHYVGDYIHIELIESSKLTIYCGEFYQESMSDGDIEYKYYSFNEIGKTNRDEWKPKYLILKTEYESLMKEKMPSYVLTRSKVIYNFKSIYNEQLETADNYGLTREEISRTGIMSQLYNMFDYLYSPHYLQELISSEGSTSIKDWEVQYMLLKKRFDQLTKVDLMDYFLIKNQTIELYKRTFNYMLPNLKYNHKNIDEQKYTSIFNSIISKLDDTQPI